MKVGIQVRCSTCGKVKAPRGRSVADVMWDSYCHPPYPDEPSCDGYYEDPKPGDLWPGETEDDFGFPCGANATIDTDTGQIS